MIISPFLKIFKLRPKIPKFSDSSLQQQMLINNQMIIQNIMAHKRRLKKPQTMKPLNELIGTPPE